MSDVELLPLEGKVPILDTESIERDALSNIDSFRDQLAGWGFMALEVPGIGKQVTRLYETFTAALASEDPNLSDFAADKIPQATPGGNHGFFRFGSEIPRLAQGKADPKEFLHISGAMLDDQPAGAADLLETFSDLEVPSRHMFELGFRVAVALGDVVREILPGHAPKLGLSRHSSILRIIHYRDRHQREVLAHEHSGIQMLGVQFPPSEGGLQYVLNDGTWVEPVIWGTDVLLCNIGRMLSEASGRRVRPSTHRVHRSEMAQSERRWSSVVFVHPNHEDEQWVITEDNDVRMLGVNWGNFVHKGLHELGLSD
jgi:isopenicillin N synthase-like dioxygenase